MAFNIMSNEALRKIARIGLKISEIAPRYRWDAIDARKELQRRDDAVIFA